MDQDKQARRVKVTEGATHRVGAKRAGIKPHKRATEPNYKQIITDYLDGLKKGSVRQTYWGTTLAKSAAAVQKYFGLGSDDELYLLLDPTATGRAGMLLSKTGLHLADGRGGTLAIGWKELASQNIAYQRGALVIGQSSVATTDGQALAALLQQLQSKIAQ